jgi:foldase protein PrsA
MASMKHVRIKFLLSAVLLGLAALVISACGSDVPTGAVAKVGDDTITQEEFDKWLATAAKGQSAQTGGTAAVPDPPDFKKCIAAKKKAPAPQGQQEPTDAELKKQCQTEYDALKTQVMQFLIQAAWVQQEAEKQGIEVSDKEIEKSFEDQKKQAFPTDKAYDDFLKSSGMTEEDILFRVKLDQLQQKLTKKVSEDAGKVTDSEIEAYYEKNKERFAQPEQRDLSVILTKTEAKANEAKKALDDGESFKKVVKEYSIDEASKAQGGALPAVTKGQQEKAFDEAIFGAEKGKIVGPVKTQFGWYVFKVDKITDASQQTLEESKDTIKNLLRSQNQQKALDKFIKDFREEYKEDTNCAEDFRVAECKNAPKEKKQGSGGGGEAAPTPENPQG